MSRNWDPEAYSVPFDVLSNLDCANAAVQPLSTILKDIVPDLSLLLDVKSKSEDSRKELENGKTTIQGSEYSLNKDFINLANQISDELSIDQKDAAELLLHGTEQEDSYDRPAQVCAVILFHRQRSYVLQCIRLILEKTGEPDAKPIIVHALDDSIKEIFKRASDKFVTKVIETMASVRQSLAELSERGKRANFLGTDKAVGYDETNSVRSKSLLLEHSLLGHIIFLLARKGLTTIDNLNKLLADASSLINYDSLLVHLVPSIIASMATVCENSTDFQKISNLHQKITSVSSDSEWRLPYWRGAVKLLWLSFFAGLCKSADDPELSELDFQKDLLDPTNSAVSEHGLEFIMSLSMDVRADSLVGDIDYGFGDSLRTTIPPPKERLELPNEIEAIVLISLETFVDALIVNIPDVLKEMRIKEEDDALARSEFDGSVTGIGNEDTFDLSLERFFIFVAYLYRGRPDSAIDFWSDPEGDLYGFMVWAAQSQTSLLVAAYCEMLASLSAGEQCSSHTHLFLMGRTPDSTLSSSLATRNRKFSRLSWEHIWNTIDQYVTQLLPPSLNNAGTPHSKSLLSLADVPQLEGESVFILAGDLRLISEVVTYSQQACYDLLTNPQIPVMDLLFDLLNCMTPLRGGILDAIAAFSKEDYFNLRLKVWTALDHWLFNTPSIMYDHLRASTGRSTHPKINRESFDARLTKFTDIVGFLKLIEILTRSNNNELPSLPYPENLGSSYRHPSFYPYVDFLMGEILATTDTEALKNDEKLSLQISLLQIILNCLNGFDAEVINISVNSLGVAADNVVDTSTLVSYLKYHPVTWTLDAIYSERNFSIIFSIISIGMDAIVDLTLSNPLLQDVLLSLQIIQSVLRLGVVYTDVLIPLQRQEPSADRLMPSSHGLSSFMDAILFNMHLVTHIAQYVAHEETELASVSLSLLTSISDSPQFSSTIDNDRRIKASRLLSAFETVDDSRRILFGFIDQLGRFNDCEERVKLKANMLKFLSDNLSKSSKIANVAHFMLGFKLTADGGLDKDTEPGGFGSTVSVISVLLVMIEEGTVTEMDYGSKNVDLTSTLLAKAAFDVVLKLCISPLTSKIALEYFRSKGLLLKCLKSCGLIDSKVAWDGQRFENGLESLCSDSANTMSDFMTFRALFLQYAALEFHEAKLAGSVSLLRRYCDALIDLSGSKAAFQFSSSVNVLALLDFTTIVIPETKGKPKLKLLRGVSFGESIQVFQNGNIEVDFDRVLSLLSLKSKELLRTTNKDREELRFDLDSEIESFVAELTSMCRRKEIREAQLDCLKSWCHLAGIILSDADMKAQIRITFILEVSQLLVPKLTSYAERDPEFASTIASLCAFLMEYYWKDLSKESEVPYARISGLLRASLLACQTPLSTEDLRSNLYAVSNQYLRFCAQNRSIAEQGLKIVSSAGEKLLEVICSDATAGEGYSRIMALMLLNAIARLSLQTQSDYFLRYIVRYNLLQMFQASLARVDSEMDLYISTPEGSSMQYELTVFRVTLSFLLQIASSREGASQIVQGSLFPMLKQCQFLHIDPDLSTSVGGVYYDLLLPILRLLLACLISMGAQNERMIEEVLNFLSSHRQMVVAMFKKALLDKRVRNETGEDAKKLDEINQLLVTIISLTGWTEVEDR